MAKPGSKKHNKPLALVVLSGSRIESFSKTAAKLWFYIPRVSIEN